MKSINLITRKITNVDFLLNALKYSFLTIIITGLICVVYQIISNPGNITFGSF